MRRSLVLLAVALPAILAAAAPAAPAPAATGIAVQGRVLGPGGAPLTGARVALYPFETERERGERLLAGRPAPAAVTETKSAADGSFALTAREPGFWTLRAEAAGHVAQENDLLPLVEEVELAAVELARERPLAVEVVGPDGKPIEGAWAAAAPEREEPFGGLFGPEEGWRPEHRLARRTAPGPLRLARGEKERLTVRAFAPGFREAKVEVAAARRNVTLKLAAAGATVAIEVRDAAGRPVAGALLLGGEGRWPLAVTAGDGRLRLPPPVVEGQELHALAAGGRRASARLRAPEPNRPAALITLPAAAPLSGRVLDAHRREPLPGALVWVDEPGTATRSDRAGGYRLVAVPAGRRLFVNAAAPGYLREAERTRPGAGEERGPTLALPPATLVRGRVVEAGSKTPLAGVEVRATPASEGPWRRPPRRFEEREALARTGADGRFTLRGLPAGVAHELHVKHAGYAPATAEAPPLEPGAAAPPLEIPLDRGRRAAGLVVDEGERPVAGATVTLELTPAREERVIRFSGDPEPPRFGATSDPRGRFEIAGLPAGRYDLTAKAPGYAPREVPGIEVTAGAGEQPLGTVILRAGTALEGRVVDPRGQPIGDAEVRVDAAGGRGPFRGFFDQENEPSARSAADGWFRVADLAPGQVVDVVVDRRGYAPAEVPGVVPPTEPLTVTLQPAVRVFGRVVDPDGKGVPDAVVTLSAERQRGSGYAMRAAGRATSDEEGRFRFDDVQPGTLRIFASAEGRQSAELAGLQAVPGRDLTGVELVLAPGAIVEGRVTDADGRPAMGAMVRPVEGLGFPTSRFFRGTVADGDGWYVLEGLPTGPRSIAAEDDQGRRAVGEIDVRSGENRLDLRLADGAEIAGRVLDADGTPLAGAEVALVTAGRPWGEREVTSGADGSFRLEGVEDGEYRVRARKDGYATAETEPLRVAGAAITGVELRLQSGGAIAGRLLGLEAEELPQVEVQANRREAFDFKSGQVDYEGRYRIPAVAPGEWRVSAEIEGTGRRAEGRVTLPPGASEVTLDLDFGSGFTLSGRVVRGDAAVPGAAVEARGSDVADSGDAETDRDGLFRITGLDAGSYDVIAQAGGAVAQEKVTLDADREVVIELAVGSVAGRVVDAADRAPIAGAAVRLEQPEREERRFWLDRSVVTTDAQGRFQLAEVAAGRWRLRVDHEGYASGDREVTVRAGVDVEEVEIALEATAGLVVEVARQTGGAPPRVFLAVVDATGKTVAGGFHPTGAEGRVRLPTVPAGSFEVLASGDGLAVGSAAAVVPGPPVRLALAPAATVELRVPALANDPALATVTARAADGTLFRFPGWAGVVESDWKMAAGRRRLEGLNAGSWTIEARAPDGRTWSGKLTLAPGQTAELVLE